MRLLPLLIALALAGCAGEPPAEADDDPAPGLLRHDLAGRVVTPAFNPIEGARVWLGQSGHCTVDACTDDWRLVEATTGGNGAFVLPGIWQGAVQVNVEHPDYEATNLTVEVPSDGLNITLVPIDRVVPFQKPWPFSGFISCSADHLIFAGSCDEFVGALDPTGTVEGTFPDEREFHFDLEDDWRTVVIDIKFDDTPPTLDGLRLAVYDPEFDAELGKYPRYHQAGGATSFTLRLEPGTDYDDNLPTPENATGMRLEVFPRGHAYHEVCSDQCFTGIGAWPEQIDFEIIATVFYHEAAPADWTLLDG